MSSLWTFMLIWGVWLITPVLIDGAEAVARYWTIRKHLVQLRKLRRVVEEDELPSVTVIVPCHNEAEVIDRCIYSLKAQVYPHDKLQFVIVDDGSTDGTADRAEKHVGATPEPGGFLLRGQPIRVGDFTGTLALIRNSHAGKAHTLNAGIALATGEIVVNIDSDVVLDPGAVRAIAEYFVLNPDSGAATGHIEIDWDIIEQRDGDGALVLDENGDLTPKKLGSMERFLAKAQFLEYLSAFGLGRRAQAIDGAVYTLAGACSAFRREIFDGGITYLNDTVSEDTLLTFELHRRGIKIGFIDEARIHLEPVTDWDALYAQRMRWARGQIEVVGVNEDLVGSRAGGRFGRLHIPKMMIFDHTLAFPRLIWAPLILCFPLLGYSWRLLAVALLAMYAFYLLLEVINAVTAYNISDRRTRTRIEESEWMLLGLPFFRFVVFHFRFAGFLAALTEKQQWTTRGPFQTARDDAQYFARMRSIQLLTSMFGMVAVSTARVARATIALVLPMLVAIVVFVGALLSTRKSG